MDDSKFGKEDSRGFWAPKEPVSYGPAFDWPPRPRALLKWFFGFPGYLSALECFVCRLPHS